MEICNLLEPIPPHLFLSTTNQRSIPEEDEKQIRCFSSPAADQGPYQTNLCMSRSLTLLLYEDKDRQISPLYLHLTLTYYLYLYFGWMSQMHMLMHGCICL